MRLFSNLILTIMFLMASAATVEAQLPSMEEMRQNMLAGGMSPEQVDEALAVISKDIQLLEGEATSKSTQSSAKPTPCEDENDNDVCDNEEDDSEVSQCGANYLDAITRFSLDNFGSRLGDDPIGIAFTCQAASVGGANGRLQPSLLPRSLSGGQAFETPLEYWGAVADNGARLSPGLRIRWQRIERLSPAARLSKLPRDMRPLIRNSDERDSFGAELNERERKREEFLLGEYFRLASPVQRRCEKIRRNVGAYYRSQYLDAAVCLAGVPVVDDELEDEE